MADLNLWQRIHGRSGIGDGTAEDAKIPIHAFWAFVLEASRGNETSARVVQVFNIASGTQQTQLEALRDLTVAAPNKERFLRVAKDWSYVAESIEDPKYRSVSNLLARLQSEITDQGGTLP